MWTAPFRIPRPWEADTPALTTDRSEHLLDFLDQVDMIIELGHVADEQERKNLLTSYLPVTKHLLWRETKTISDGNSCHPEIAERMHGSLEGLDKLCKSFGKISRSSAGILRRFSMQFCALVERLQRPPTLLTNRDARWTTSSHSVYKERLGSGKLCAFCFGSLESRHKENFERKEDLIQLRDLVEIVDTIAACEHGEAIMEKNQVADTQHMWRMHQECGPVLAIAGWLANQLAALFWRMQELESAVTQDSLWIMRGDVTIPGQAW
ncbi:hypothetical protein DFH08DRAFT_810460 [Mycena albidolilacea]|uniref:Uncharacterized protein n=1 Tax=Mycena albidolilacea TaxID=1033008 RepID=A0AAD6ZY47_9AGAR|nr:hypothetical protein DFH08DRAFT_810460 [Mycena albidolilacea]